MLLRYLVVHHPCCCASCFHFPVSCATVSPVVLPASDAAAVSRLLSSLLLHFLLLPSVSCATFSTRVLSASAAAAVFFASFLVSCASFSFLAAAFFYRDDNILIPFLELGHFNVVFLAFSSCSAYTVVSCFVFPSPDIDFLLRHVDQESSHYTSVVTSHVNHVVGLSVLHIPQESSSWSKCSRFVFPSLSERRRTSVSAAFF